jgi:putative ferrous iron transport protein C
MTPSDLRLHLKLNMVCNMQDLTIRFQRDPETIRQAMQVWINKGKVCHRQQTELCGQGCQRCDPLMTELYEWLK